MSKYRSFKGTERAVAKLLNGQRHGHLGGRDIDAGWLSAEVKHRQDLPAWLLAAMRQAEGHAQPGQLAVVILHQHGDRHADNLVVMRLAEFQARLGEQPEIAEVLTPDKPR